MRQNKNSFGINKAHTSVELVIEYNLQSVKILQSYSVIDASIVFHQLMSFDIVALISC